MINLYYIGADEDFARNSAGALRIINNCKAISQNPIYNIRIIGYSDIEYLTKDSYEVFNTKRGKNALQKFFYYLVRSFSIIKLLKRFLEKPDIIIYYGTSARILFPLLQYCKHNQIKLIEDVVEWYNYSHLPFGKYGPLAIDVNLAMTKLIHKCNGVIVISTFLQNYYNYKVNKILKVPILIDNVIQTLPINESISFDSDYLNLIYAGFPGRKDLLFNVITAVEYCSSIGFAVKLHILGPTKNELGSFFKHQFSNSIIFHGKVSQSLVSENLKRADFSVLLRPDERYAHAGFPTKFVESLNSGLPVIANITSDLANYLIDGYNGFIVPDSSVNSFVAVLKKILSKDKNEFKKMKINAQKTAKENFQYQLFSKCLSDFILDIVNEGNSS